MVTFVLIATGLRLQTTSNALRLQGAAAPSAAAAHSERSQPGGWPSGADQPTGAYASAAVTRKPTCMSGEW